MPSGLQSHSGSSIIPLGGSIASTTEEQAVATVRVYPGTDSDFTLYNDDGKDVRLRDW